MGVINKTTEKINELLDKVEQGGSIQVEWNDVINKPTWVTSSTKPSYTASEVGAIPTGGLKTINGQSLEGSGNIEISGSGSGIPDAPADNEIYGRKNNNWEKIVSTGFPMFDATELVNLADVGESDLTPTLKSSIISAYENKATFAFTDTEQLALLSIISKDTGYNLIMQLNIPYDIYGMYYVSLIADVNTTTDKITVTSNAMILPSNTQVPTEAPTDGKTYGRNNKQWVEIISSGGGGGSVQVVDISEIYARYVLEAIEEASGTMTKEDYDTLESYANNKDIICVVKSATSGMITAFVNLFADTSSLFIYFYDLFYGLLPTPIVYNVSKSDFTYRVIRQAVLTSFSMTEKNLYLSKYAKPETYTPITTSDSILGAIGKLEAGISQSGSGGGVQAVDITELISRLILVSVEESTISDEDYALLEKYCAEHSLLYAMQDGYVSGRFSLFKNGDSYQLEQINLNSLGTYLQIQSIEISSLKKVKIYSKYIDLSASTGGSSVYIVSSDIFNLNADSTSEEISQVIGGVEGMQTMIQAVKDGKRLVARAVTPDSVGNILNADLILSAYRDTDDSYAIGFTAIVYFVFGLIMPAYFIHYDKTIQKFSINYVDINQEHSK